jgi:hypothetical protein
MSGFPILDLVIGMIFIYFLLSIISSSLVEIVLSSFKIRSQVLEEWLLTIFDKKMLQPDGSNTTLGRAIMDHCMTTALAKSGRATSFMDAKNFVSALLEKVSFNPADPDYIATNLEEIAKCIQNATALNGTPLLSTELKRTLLLYVNEARAAYQANGNNTVSELQLFREKLEGWFDSSMDRLQGTMKKRYVRPITLFVAVLITLSLNADSVALTKYLYSNPEARTKIVAQAYKVAQDTLMQKTIDSLEKFQAGKEPAMALRETQKQLKDGLATLQEAGIPLGWDHDSKEQELTRVAGWLATVLAIMLGAPFWFDLLNKIANLRGTGPRPASSTDKDGKSS